MCLRMLNVPNRATFELYKQSHDELDAHQQWRFPNVNLLNDVEWFGELLLYCYTYYYYRAISSEVSMEATAQLNVRIEPELKKAGDRVLAEHGLTPSEAIRGLYRKLAGEQEQVEEAFAVIANSIQDEDARLVECERKAQSIRDVQKAVNDFQKTYGITEYPTDVASDKELLEMAIVEHYNKKGSFA